MLFFDFSKKFSAEMGIVTCHNFYETENPLPLVHDEDVSYSGQNQDVDLSLQIVQEQDNESAKLSLCVRVKTACRIEFRFHGTDKASYHIMPGFLFGSNNYANSGGGHFPNLVPFPGHDVPKSVASRWLCRADRLSCPVSIAIGAKNGHVAISGPPYATTADGRSIPCGFGAETPSTVIYSLGSINHPCTFENKNLFTEPVEKVLPRHSEINLDMDLFMGVRSDSYTAFQIVRKVYDTVHEPPQTELSAEECCRAIADVMAEDTWIPQTRTFMACKVEGLPYAEQRKKIGGRALAWVGGVVVAYPLLLAGCRYEEKKWREIACSAFDRVAESWNEASGMFFDALNEDGTPGVNYWWSGNTNRDLHSAYTGAQIVYYLLKATLLLAGREEKAPELWTSRAVRTLDTMLSLQREDGNCGYAYRPDRPEVADWEGFAGAWWIPAFCLGHRLTGRTDFLDAAKRAAAYYYAILQTLDVWGTPMDTYKSNDEEGNLAFLRGVRLLHEITNDDSYLKMMEFSADYECLWRYCFNTTPLADPLKSANWHSSGGSITSVSNPHIHPMHLLVSSDFQYLYEQTGDEYYAMRLEDSLLWARNCIEIYPEKTGYGRLGWSGERFCPSDGLLITKYSDGTPASTELGLNLWAPSAMLEGLLEVEQNDNP
jgi:hypothetical protein